MQAEFTTRAQTLNSPVSPARIAALDAVPLFHAACLFAVGIAGTHWLWLRPGIVLVSLALLAILCGLAALRAAHRVASDGVALVPAGRVVRGDGAPPCPAPALVEVSDGLLRTVLAVLMPAALLTLLALSIWPAAAFVPAMLAALVLHLGVRLVHLFGSLAFGDFRIPAPLLGQSMVFCVLMGAAIVLAWLGASTGARWPRLGAWAAMLLAAVAAVAPRRIQHPGNARWLKPSTLGKAIPCC